MALSRSTLLLALCCTAALALPARADEPVDGPTNRASIGVMVGAPTGLLFEKDLNPDVAIDFGIGAIYSPGARLNVDVLLTVLQARSAGLFFRVQVGLGAMGGLLIRPCGFYSDFGSCSGNVYTGARLPVALEFWPRAPVVFGVEAAPALGFNRTGATALLDAFLFARWVL